MYARAPDTHEDAQVPGRPARVPLATVGTASVVWPLHELLEDLGVPLIQSLVRCSLASGCHVSLDPFKLAFLKNRLVTGHGDFFFEFRRES